MLPLHAPLFFLLTYPLRWFPAEWQPISLNLFAAACSALTLGLLARSVALLPHDRTLAQRQRERSEFSFLSIPPAWLPPVFAALACGLQLTFWEHAVAATNESLSLLVFAYVIRCLLEYRVDQRERWLTRFAFVYGLGVTNNWAMIGFFPCFLIALAWIRGGSFFQPRFIGRMIGFGAAGLALYLMLPVAWAFADSTAVDFWQALKTQLATQKGLLLRPDVRNKAFILLLTSVLPVFIMGIRWPSSFGDTSAAGAVITNLMFRVVHVVLWAVCLWTVFDQQFSPRALITKRHLNPPSMLTFYYLTALSIGYLSGYLVLVFGPGMDRFSKRRGHSVSWTDRAIFVAVCLAFLAVPAGLIYKNSKNLWDTGTPHLKQFAEHCAAPLPPQDAIVVSDDLSSLLLLQAHLNSTPAAGRHVLVHSRSLPIPEYHRQLVKRYPQRWPDILAGEPQGDLVDDFTLLTNLIHLSVTNQIYYLHPSFGFYFESFHARPQGLGYRLQSYGTNLSMPPLATAEFASNQGFWTKIEPSLERLKELTSRDSRDAHFLAMFYSRALNDWGVTAQRLGRLEEAGKYFERAASLNTNNKPAQVNLQFNRQLRPGGGQATQASRSADERLGGYRDLETLLVYNGPFDEPESCFDVGQLFLQQSLYRQAALQFDRVRAFQPTNLLARLGLASAYLQSGLQDLALEQIVQVRALTNLPPLTPDLDLSMTRIEASAYFAKTNFAAAEMTLLKANQKYPDRPSALEALERFYAHAKQTTNALLTIEKLLQKDPGNVEALIDQASIHFNNGEFTQAISSLDRILQKDSRNVQALLYRVIVFKETRDYTKALAEADRVLEIEPDNHEGLLHKGALLIETKAYENAMKPLNRLLELRPNDPNGLRNRAIANLQRDRLDEAQRDYGILQRQAPRYHVPYFGLAEIAYRRKETAVAIRNYEYYLRYAPKAKDESDLGAEMRMVNDRLKELRASRN